MDINGAHHAAHEFFLPPELLTRVLQQLGQPDILKSCSLVSRNWKAVTEGAAAAQGIEVIINAYKCEKAHKQIESLLSWLAKNGRQLTSMKWGCIGLIQEQVQQQVCLPYHHLGQLQRLHLSSMRLATSSITRSTASKVSAAAMGTTACQCGSAGHLAALTSLTELELCLSGICSGGLCCLTALQALQQLRLRDVSMLAFSAALPVLKQLTQLSSLQLTDVSGRSVDRVPVQFSSLQQLQELHVAGSPEFDYDQLPSNLATLSLSFDYKTTTDDIGLHLPNNQGNGWPDNAGNGWPDNQDSDDLDNEDNEPHGAPYPQDWVLSSRSTPGIASLEALQTLELVGIKGVEPAVLPGLGQLSRIVLGVAQFNVQSLAALLAVLPRLQQVAHLEIKRCGSPVVLGRWGKSSLLPPPEACAAVNWERLPAACCLQYLTRMVFKNMSWPAGTGQHIFRTGWQFPALRQLELAYGATDEWARYVEGDDDNEDEDENAGCGAWLLPKAAAAPLAAADLAWLASILPSSRELGCHWSSAARRGSVP